MIKNFYNNRLKKKNPANRRLSTSANITPFTINNFNHNPITSTTTIKTTTNTTNTFNTINTTTNNINHKHNNNYNYYNNEYLQEKDISYYDVSNLRRSDSARTVVAEEDSYHTKVMIAENNYSTTNLTRNGSVRSIMTNSSAKTIVEYEHEYNKTPFLTTQMPSSQLPSPPPSAGNTKFSF
jgi:hypothetical protein